MGYAELRTEGLIMSVLSEIVRNILIIIILASFLELLLPAGTIRPFVRFAIGLFILIAVLNPLLGYLFHGHNFQVANWWDCQIDKDIGDSIAVEGQEINERMINQNQQMFKGKLEGQINAVVLLVPGIEEVDTEAEITDGRIDRLEFTVYLEKIEVEDTGEINLFSEILEESSVEKKQQIEKKISSVVSNMYGLEADKIKINFKGGG